MLNCTTKPSKGQNTFQHPSFSSCDPPPQIIIYLSSRLFQDFFLMLSRQAISFLDLFPPHSPPIPLYTIEDNWRQGTSGFCIPTHLDRFITKKASDILVKNEIAWLLLIKAVHVWHWNSPNCPHDHTTVADHHFSCLNGRGGAEKHNNPQL